MFLKRRYNMSEYFVANIRKSLPVLSLKFTQNKALLNLRLSRLLRRQNPLLTRRDHLALWPKNRQQDLPQSYPSSNRNDSCKLRYPGCFRCCSLGFSGLFLSVMHPGNSLASLKSLQSAAMVGKLSCVSCGCQFINRIPSIF